MRTPNTTYILDRMRLIEVEVILAKGGILTHHSFEKTLRHLENARKEIQKVESEIRKNNGIKEEPTT